MESGLKDDGKDSPFTRHEIKASLRNELSKHGLSPRKRLGQHFLIDRNIIEKVIRVAGVERDDVVLEVGPGLGEMTYRLAQRAKGVIAVEIDSRLVEILRQKMSAITNVEIVEEDILKTDFEVLAYRVKSPLKVVANLPYQISTPLLFRLIELRRLFSDLTLMLQREVVERITAPPGEKAYGALSVLIQSVSHPSLQFVVKPSAFFPPPKVESAVVQIVWKEKPSIEEKEEEWFKKVVRASFGYRRKTLLNALKLSRLVPLETIELKMDAIGIDPQRRPETLSLEEFVRLAKVLK